MLLITHRIHFLAFLLFLSLPVPFSSNIDSATRAGNCCETNGAFSSHSHLVCEPEQMNHHLLSCAVVPLSIAVGVDHRHQSLSL